MKPLSNVGRQDTAREIRITPRDWQTAQAIAESLGLERVMERLAQELSGVQS